MTDKKIPIELTREKIHSATIDMAFKFCKDCEVGENCKSCSIATVLKALDLQFPKSPVEKEDYNGWDELHCPNCDKVFTVKPYGDELNKNNTSYCSCGQLIDWDGVECHDK